MRRPVLLPVLLAAGLVAAAACSSGADSRAVRTGATPSQTSGILKTPQRVVQIGDSIASGEGIDYGYTYNPDSREWTGGDLNATWAEPYQGCHVSDITHGLAYGSRVATFFHATFTQFACSGATFANGVRAPQLSNGNVLRPAQFGDYTAKTNLNAAYDEANPDLVLVTLGADDVQFSAIVEHCIYNAYYYYFGVSKEECISTNPGTTIQQDFFDYLPTLRKDYATLIGWIQQRARDHNQPVPKVVFTTYANPLPDSGVKCPDVSWLYPAQVDYLSSLVGMMDQTIIASMPVGGRGVTVADIQKAYRPLDADHRFCSSDPWVYGLSIYHLTDRSSFKSQAPFHPTPSGQQSIADFVAPAVVRLFNTPLENPAAPTSPSSSTTGSTAAPSTTSSSSSTTTTSSP